MPPSQLLLLLLLSINLSEPVPLQSKQQSSPRSCCLLLASFSSSSNRLQASSEPAIRLESSLFTLNCSLSSWSRGCCFRAEAARSWVGSESGDACRALIEPEAGADVDGLCLDGFLNFLLKINSKSACWLIIIASSKLKSRSVDSATRFIASKIMELLSSLDSCRNNCCFFSLNKVSLVLKFDSLLEFFSRKLLFWAVFFRERFCVRIATFVWDSG